MSEPLTTEERKVFRELEAATPGPLHAGLRSKCTRNSNDETDTHIPVFDETSRCLAHFFFQADAELFATARTALPRCLDALDAADKRVAELREESVEYERLFVNLCDAVRTHRDQRGDDRCWLDDERLYDMLPEGYTPPARDTAVELERCRQYIECRHNPATEYVSPQRRIAELEAENARLRNEIATVERMHAPLTIIDPDATFFHESGADHE